MSVFRAHVILPGDLPEDQELNAFMSVHGEGYNVAPYELARVPYPDAEHMRSSLGAGADDSPAEVVRAWFGEGCEVIPGPLFIHVRTTANPAPRWREWRVGAPFRAWSRTSERWTYRLAAGDHGVEHEEKLAQERAAAEHDALFEMRGLCDARPYQFDLDRLGPDEARASYEAQPWCRAARAVAPDAPVDLHDYFKVGAGGEKAMVEAARQRAGAPHALLDPSGEWVDATDLPEGDTMKQRYLAARERFPACRLIVVAYTKPLGQS